MIQVREALTIFLQKFKPFDVLRMLILRPQVFVSVGNSYGLRFHDVKKLPIVGNAVLGMF